LPVEWLPGTVSVPEIERGIEPGLRRRQRHAVLSSGPLLRRQGRARSLDQSARSFRRNACNGAPRDCGTSMRRAHARRAASQIL